MAIGVPGRTEYGCSDECVWVSLNGGGLVRLEIRRSDQDAVLYSPEQVPRAPSHTVYCARCQLAEAASVLRGQDLS